MNSIALIGDDNSDYFVSILRALVKSKLTLSYLIICGSNKSDFANTIYAIDNNFSLKNIEKIQCNLINPNLIQICEENSIPCFWVNQSNSPIVSRILSQYPVDVLFVTKWPIKEEVIYIPRLFVLSCCTSSVPTGTENVTINFPLNHKYSGMVYLYVMQPYTNREIILVKKRYNINKEDTLEKVNKKLQIECINLSIEVLNKIQNDKIPQLHYQKE
ncbi:hypothetical protein N3Z16_06450 [Candidatus Megaera polyxenophila]|jgi:hypothetical protein|uniref:hypothetical protein n=1 Tax=Candidatus Megaera polyxenophila TaxID=988779 RepID=UPI00249EDA3C|nr:hypothetical protein N3Z16_06450 [Candidatus Megaera polyxenophila]